MAAASGFGCRLRASVRSSSHFYRSPHDLPHPAPGRVSGLRRCGWPSTGVGAVTSRLSRLEALAGLSARVCSRCGRPRRRPLPLCSACAKISPSGRRRERERKRRARARARARAQQSTTAT
jgi:hypothetical protein